MRTLECKDIVRDMHIHKIIHVIIDSFSYACAEVQDIIEQYEAPANHELTEERMEI